MNRWVKETGFLTEIGEEELTGFKKALADLLNRPEAKAMSIGEIRTLGSLLKNIVGTTIFERQQNISRAGEPFSEMTDTEFEIYLQDKYGKEWMLKALPPEEMKRAMKFASMIDLFKEKLGNELVPLPPQHGVRFPKKGPIYK